MRPTRAHIFLLNRLNLGRKQVTKQEFILLWEKNQQNSLTASYAAVTEKVNKYHFWKNLRWDEYTQLPLWSPNSVRTQRSWRSSQFNKSSPGCQRKLPGHLRWIQNEECYLNTSSSPSYWQHWSDPSRVLPPQLGRDKALLNPVTHWVGANPGQFAIYHCTFKIFTKHIHKTLQPLGTQGGEGSIENTAQGRQQEHLLSDSQERGGEEEEREVSYH